MKREAKFLLAKACDALVLSIELFNRPNDRGRASSTLIYLGHSLEIFMKAAILHRGGKILDRSSKETISFKICVERSLSDGRIKYLVDNQKITLKTINESRNAAYHYLLDIREENLYLYIQSGVTLFRDLLESVFGQKLSTHLPKRVLPISTSPLTSLAVFFDTEVAEIKKLLQPGKRQRIEASARLRPLAILDNAIQGREGQPSDSYLKRLGDDVVAGNSWQNVFKGVQAFEISADGAGPSLSLRLSKKEGIPIRLVPKGTPGVYTIVKKPTNELDYYSLGAQQLAEKVDLSTYQTVAVVDYLKLRQDQEYYKEFRFGKSACHKQYSQKAIGKIKATLEVENIEKICARVRQIRAKKLK